MNRDALPTGAHACLSRRNCAWNLDGVVPLQVWKPG